MIYRVIIFILLCIGLIAVVIRIITRAERSIKCDG